MAPKTRSDDPPPHAPIDIDRHSYEQSSLAPTHDTPALVLEQMALINARLGAQATDIDVQHHRDAQRNTPRNAHPTTPI
jgi:hypothetical protein